MGTIIIVVIRDAAETIGGTNKHHQTNLTSIWLLTPKYRMQSQTDFTIIGVGMRGAGGGSAPPLSKVGGPAICFGPPLFIREPFALIGPFDDFGAWLKLFE